ncbi:hypothetical protein PHYPSEUDO_012559 [Phytophthora pseudosyringae]|uniref:Uncharacterized protein n=1 Tax=Phytophthora pseudosyringae TaxID=221518 RepID=A0A8T1V7A6_9STRA|nr:hypothetical protein PHYPSEUDO_012559 [Phytophthora pseudosyringae]
MCTPSLYERLIATEVASSTTGWTILEETVIFAEFVYPPPLPQLHIRVPSNFNALSDSVCKKRFMFAKSELCMLVKFMDISDVVIRERTTTTAFGALCVLLYKLAVSMRLENVEDL